VLKKTLTDEKYSAVKQENVATDAPTTTVTKVFDYCMAIPSHQPVIRRTRQNTKNTRNSL